LLYFGPIVLRDILPEEYYIHFLLLSCAITLFLGVSLPDNLVNLGEEMLQIYLINFEGLYGLILFFLLFIDIFSKQNKTKQNKTKQNKTKQNKTKQNKTKHTLTADKLTNLLSLSFFFLLGARWMSKTTHSLSHIAGCVRKTGPLWTASCFPFESFYHFGIQMIHGTRYVLHQVYIDFYYESKKEKKEKKEKKKKKKKKRKKKGKKTRKKNLTLWLGVLAAPLRVHLPPSKGAIWNAPHSRAAGVREEHRRIAHLGSIRHQKTADDHHSRDDPPRCLCPWKELK
jgi:Ca2+/Na+ antiporter